jgi:hypothetical protein
MERLATCDFIALDLPHQGRAADQDIEGARADCSAVLGEQYAQHSFFGLRSEFTCQRIFCLSQAWQDTTAAVPAV